MIDGKYLKELRIKHHYSAQDLADLLHVSKATVYRWERENSLRDNDLINALANLYGMSAEQLYKGSLSCETAVTTEEAEQEEIAPAEDTAGTEEKAAKKQLSLVKIGAITAASTFTAFVLITIIIILHILFQQNLFDGVKIETTFSAFDIVIIVCTALLSIVTITTATVLTVYFIRKRRK